MGTILITIFKDRVPLNSVPFFSNLSSESSLRTLSEIRHTLWTALAVFNHNLCSFSSLGAQSVRYTISTLAYKKFLCSVIWEILDAAMEVGL